MTNKARELLELSLNALELHCSDYTVLSKEIRAYLANDELETSQEEENHKLHQARMQWLKDQNQACNWRNS